MGMAPTRTPAPEHVPAGDKMQTVHRRRTLPEWPLRSRFSRLSRGPGALVKAARMTNIDFATTAHIGATEARLGSWFDWEQGEEGDPWKRLQSSWRARSRSL